LLAISAGNCPATGAYTVQNVAIGNKVITSNGGPVSYQAAFELLAKLSSEKNSREISESIQFNRLDRAFLPR